MAALANLVGFTTTTTGTGTITVGSALQGLRTLAGASIADATVVSYAIKTGAAGSEQYENGTGTVGASGTTLTRTLVSSSTGSLLNLSGTSEVYITDLAGDHENGRIPTLAVADEATTNNPGGPAIAYSSTTFRMMGWVVDRWKSLANLIAANTWIGAQRGTPVTLTPSGTITIDASLGNYYTLAPNANFGFANPTNLVAGQSFAVRIPQPASGGPRTITSWGSVFKYPGGISAVPALSTAANAVDTIYFTVWSSTEVEILGIRKDIKS